MRVTFLSVMVIVCLMVASSCFATSSHNWRAWACTSGYVDGKCATEYGCGECGGVGCGWQWGCGYGFYPMAFARNVITYPITVLSDACCVATSLFYDADCFACK